MSTRLRRARSFLGYMLGALLIFPSSASAETIHGILMGCLTYFNTREEGCSALTESGCLVASSQQEQPLNGAYVELLKPGLFGLEKIGSSTTSTNNGCYTIPWRTEGEYGFLGFIRVEARSPERFRVTDSGGAQLAFMFARDNMQNFVNDGTRSVEFWDHWQVYATAFEFWDRIVINSPILSQRMTNVRIAANINLAQSAPCCDGFGCMSSCTVDKDYVRIFQGNGRERPITSVAHELGHAALLHALGQSNAAYDAQCPATHQFDVAHACEAVAWHEGMANFFATRFSFSENATAARFGPLNGDFGGSVETPINECGTDPQPFRIEGCITAAVWDLVDDPANDDDPRDNNTLGVGLRSIAGALSNYCWWWADRCGNEGGLHGTNHWDFLFNFSQERSDVAAEARQIYDALGLNIGGEEPVP